MTRRTSLFNVCIGVLAVFMTVGTGYASTLIPQTALPGDCIPKFASPLPIFGPGYNAALPRVDAASHPTLTITMKDVNQLVLPLRAAVPGGYPATYTDPFTGTPQACPAVHIKSTRVAAYEIADTVT